MKQVQGVWFIALKDLRLFSKDRMAMLFALLFPFLFATMFYFLLSGTGNQDTRLELHLATQEAPGGISHQILQALETKDETQLKPGEPKIVWDKDYDMARRQVEEKKLSGFIGFPEDFTTGVMMGYGSHLDIIINADSTNLLAALNGLAQGIAAQVNSQQVASSAIIGLTVEQAETSGNLQDIGPAISKFMQGIYGAPQSNASGQQASFITSTVEQVGAVKAENPSNYVIPGYLVMFVFFAAALSAETIVRERKNQTLERLLAGSVRRETILGGMFTGITVKGLIQIALFWLVGLLIFKMELGLAPAAVVILSLLMVILSAAFSIMLATVVKSQRAAGALAVLLSLVMAPLGGCWWPLFITPKWMQFLAQLTPHGWANLGFNKLMVFGGDFASAVPNMIALGVFTVVFLGIAVVKFKTDAV